MRIRRYAAVIAVAVLAGACSSSGENPPRPKAESAPQAIDPDRELKVGLGGDTYVLSGPSASLGANANIAETLVYLSPTFEPKPLLAERWELRTNLAEPDRTTWRFYIRQGVRFHDGQPLNAQAVKQGLFDRAARLRNGGAIRAGADSAVVVDEYTIDFTPVVANMRVPEQLVHPATGAVLAPGTSMETKTVGTGPFRFVEYRTKEFLVVERNPDYWGAKAAAAKVTFKFYADPAARMLALLAGEVHVAFDIPRPDVAGLKQQGFQVMPSPVGSYLALYLNRANGILSDRDVRVALAGAINRQGLVNGVFEGLAATSQTLVPADALGRFAAEVKGIAYDSAGAARALDRAGWAPGPDGIRRKGGDRLELTLVSGYPSSEALKPTPAYLQQELRKVGVDLKIDEVPDEATFTARLKEAKADMYLEQGSQNDANPAFLPTTLLYSGAGASAETRTVSALGEPFDAMLAPAFREADLDRVRATVARALHLVIDQEATVVPLAGMYRLYAMNDKVRGLTPHPAVLNMRWAEAGLVSG